MIARVKTVAFQGIEAIPVDVQVQMSSGLPAFTIVGLPDKAVGESRERVRAALHSIGLSLPPKRITVNLSPADLQKEGSHYDLPIALGLLVSMEILLPDEMSRYLVVGELALDGGITEISGVLPAAITAASENLGLICPHKCGGEAAWAEGIEILAATDLLSLMNHFKGTQVLIAPEPRAPESPKHILDLQDIKGQETAKRALEIAAAGQHNMLMQGPPGSGKSMLASRLSSILPPLSPEEALEVTMIHSIAGQLNDAELVRQRPFRDPHHSASLPALVGGGMKAHPGEISLAHHGVLFLDELPEFSRATLETLRQPLETGKVTVSRANAHVTYPAQFQLISAMNPCRCGHLDDPERACSRAPKCAVDYQSKISGPLLDRIDLNVFVPAVKAIDLALPKSKESSKDVAARVLEARQIQKQRFEQYNETATSKTNAGLTSKMLEEVAVPDAGGAKILSEAAEKLKLSARGYHRILKVARTIADLDKSDNIRQVHISEALVFRQISGL